MLAQALGITRQRDDGKDICSAASDLIVASDGFTLDAAEIAATPRINVHTAPLDLWRYIVKGSPFVSGPKWR